MPTKTAPNAHLLGVGEVKNGSKNPLPPHPLGNLDGRADGAVLGDVESVGEIDGSEESVGPAVAVGC